MKNITIWLLLAAAGLGFCNRVREKVSIRTDIAEARQAVELVYSSLLNAETAQRGYLLTGNDVYLEPYHKAEKILPAALFNAKSFLTNKPRMLTKIDRVEELTQMKMTELATTIEANREQGTTAALNIVRTNVGKNDMDQIRILLFEIEEEQTREWYSVAADLSVMMFANSMTLGLIVIWAIFTYLSELGVWLRFLKSRKSCV